MENVASAQKEKRIESNARPANLADGQYQTSDSVDRENPQYLSGITLYMMMLALMSGVFVMGLDNNILATAAPKITTEFDSLDDVGWYGSAYLLTQMSLQPLFGRLYTFFNVKWIYISSCIIFELGSIVIATATGSMMLIVGRALAGTGAAGLFTGTVIIIGHIIPLSQRPRYVSYAGSMHGVAAVAGPLLGAFGGLAAILIAMLYHSSPAGDPSLSWKEKLQSLDIIGGSFLIASMVLLLIALQWGGNVYAWSDSHSWGCLIGFALLLSISIALQFRDQTKYDLFSYDLPIVGISPLTLSNRATIPPRILSQRTVAASCAFSFFSTMAWNTHAYYLPFYFQAVKGTTAAVSGVCILPLLVTQTFTTLLSGAAISKVGYYVPFVWSGTILLITGSSLLLLIRTNTLNSTLDGYQFLDGLGSGLSVQIPFVAVQVVLSESDMATGIALAGFFNAFGGMLSISVAENILTNCLEQRLRSIPGLNAKAVVSAGPTNVVSAVPLALLEPVREAYNYAISRAFIFAVVTGVIALAASLALEWKSVREPATGSTAVADGRGEDAEKSSRNDTR